MTLNTKDLSTFLDNLDMKFDMDVADTTTFGTTWKSGLTGIPGGTIDISGFYDPTATTGPGAVLYPLAVAGTAVTALVYPGGTASGQVLYTITSGCIVTSYAESSSATGIVAFKASLLITVLPVRTVI